MNCCDCKSPNMGVSEIILRDKSTQKVIYCLDCGKVQNKVEVEAEPAPRVHKSWAERRAEAEANAPKHVSWKERKARKQTRSTATTTPAPVQSVQSAPSNPPTSVSDDSVPF